MSVEDGADAVGEEMGDQAIDRFAFSRHRAALRGRNARGQFPERTNGLGRRQAAVAELEGADQGTVDDEVRIAPDRRREMGVALEIEAEMAVVLRGVLGLGLRAQHHLVDEIFSIASADALKNAVEAVWPQGAALRQRDIQRRQEFPQGMELLDRRFVMD